MGLTQGMGRPGPEPGTSIHAELKQAFICPDGEHGSRLQVRTPGGETFVFPLTGNRAAWLLKALAECLAGQVKEGA